MGSVLFEITLIICLATGLSIVFRLLRQPPILAYILTGILIGPFGQLQLAHVDQLKSLAQLGITLLLFMMGLEFKLKDLKSIGLTAGIVGVGQILVTAAFGYAISIFMGFSHLSSVYLSIAVTFSSTIIIVKLLSDKKDLNSLYGKISVGLLLVQDFCAVLILMLLSTVDSSGNSLPVLSFIGALLKGAGLFALTIFLSKKVFPNILSSIAKTEETLFLFSLAWVFGFAGVISSPLIGFPIEIGGFMAGLALANSLENLQIAARVKGLRDFFITIFFVMIGMEMTFRNFNSIVIPAILFSVFVLLIKPIIVMGIMGVLGYRKRTSFLAGIVTSQVSEFSIIIIFLGASLGHVSSDVVSLVAVVSVITFGFSAYLIMYGNALYIWCGKYLLFLERGTIHENHVESLQELKNRKNHVVLIGSNRMGESILDALTEEGEDVVVVDFDPDVVARLKKKKIVSIFGDIADVDIQDRAQVGRAKLVISTVPDIEDNLILIRSLKNARKIKIVVMAREIEEARVLYKAGADYVILPHLAGGRHLAKIIKDDTLSKLESFKSKDEKYLRSG